ncbi:MAG: succinyl-CoA synthetase subunit beta [Methanocella sp. PtaU1.Bin125]|nr:MAG: succinyl-CoA synthetase subunit beta [Methanocella sp. PtaU1.Bin125]
MMLNEMEAKRLFSQYGIRVNDGIGVKTPAEAADAAEKLGFPVVVKVLSGKIIHKSDMGLVALDIRTADCARGACERILTAARAIDPEATAVVEPMAPDGVAEVIIGGKRDPQFGPTVLFGLGGVFVEVFKDVSLRVAPVNHAIALKMIRETKGYTILKGFRGKQGADLDALADILVSISRLMMTREDVMELDVNPVIAYTHGAVAVDARVLLRDKD